MESKNKTRSLLADLTVKEDGFVKDNGFSIIDIFEFNIHRIQNEFGAENIKARMSCETFADIIFASLGKGWSTDILQEDAWFKGAKMTLKKDLPEKKVIFEW